ncbi:hypothetical protein KIPB_013232 [Kipferlia bialata]|uniref:Uncharacterized protein n=1 Tax=Kipferlia bialata TaxID=797122 RepID=A0A9K3D7N8_9EUKA|nr:hypothetical protein KIPB_013232 [Kipferlia bialata]|eukprot:g13232.t1
MPLQVSIRLPGEDHSLLEFTTPGDVDPTTPLSTIVARVDARRAALPVVSEVVAAVPESVPTEAVPASDGPSEVTEVRYKWNPLTLVNATQFTQPHDLSL